MTRKKLCAYCAILMAGTTVASPSHAQLEVNVPIGSGGSATAPGPIVAEREMKKIPGGADIVPAEEYKEGAALTIKDMLQNTPGVFAQPKWGDDSRLSIRGSGLSRAFHLRGVSLFQDGVPLNFADGSGDFQEFDPLALQYLEVYRGGQGLRYGTASLGGVINMVTPTARTIDYNGLLRAEMGSFNTLRLHGEAAKALDGVDAFASLTKSSSDGYRRQSDQNNIRFTGNTGIALGDKAETRFYLTYNDIEQEVASSISKADALNNPKTVPANTIVSDYARDIHSLRVANKTAVVLDSGLKLEIGAYANDKHLYHPIFQVLDQKSVDVGGFARASGDYNIDGFANDFTIGFNTSHGNNDAKRFVNIEGNRGALTADGKQIAKNYELYGENRFHFAPDWSLITGLQASYAIRDYTDNLNAANNDDEIYTSLNPKLGVLWNYAPQSEAYASITRSSEVPTFSELVQGAIPGFVPVKLQRAWTAEIGTRGQQGAFSWDVTAYHARVRKELLNYTVTADVPASTFNADETIHQGLELGAGWQANQWLSFNAIYNFNDFRFDGDAQFGDNELAGAPRHQIRLSARMEHKGAFIEPNVEIIPSAPYVDYANTLKADDYALLGVNAGWEINERVSLFVDARNLTNEKTITNYSTITDARTAATNVFYPVDGRSVFGGIKVKF